MSEKAPAETDKKVITRGQSLGITASSIIGAVAVFLVTIISSRVLSTQDNNQFLVFWSLMFGVFGALLGIQQEVTRAVGHTRSLKQSSGAGRGSARVLPVAALWGLILAVLVLVTSPLWGEHILGKEYFLSLLVIAAGAILYACHVSVVGSAAGTGNWSIFAWLTGLESVLRLVLTVIVALTLAHLWGFQFAAIAPVILWLLLFAFSPQARRELGATRVEGTSSTLVKTMGWSILTSAAYAVMVTGFPVLIKATTGQPENAHEELMMGAVIIGINLTRAPIMIPLQMFQGVAVSAFLKQQHRPIAALVKPIAALLGVGVIGAIAAFLIGPFLFNLLYSDYKGALNGWVLAALTFASAFMAVVVLTGTAALATSRHRLYLAGWAITVAVAVAVLLLPLAIEERALIALIAGPLAGTLVHIAGLAFLPPAPSHLPAASAPEKDTL